MIHLTRPLKTTLSLKRLFKDSDALIAYSSFWFVYRNIAMQAVYVFINSSDYHLWLMMGMIHIMRPSKTTLLWRDCQQISCPPLLVCLTGRLAHAMQTVFIDSSDCHPLLMTGIVSPGGLCSPLLWMSRFVLPPGGPTTSHLPLPLPFSHAICMAPLHTLWFKLWIELVFWFLHTCCLT